MGQHDGQRAVYGNGAKVVVVVTSSTSVNDERFGYRRQLFELIERQVLAPLRAAAVAR